MRRRTTVRDDERPHFVISTTIDWLPGRDAAPAVNNVLASGNRFKDGTTPFVGNPAVVLAIDEAGSAPAP